MVKSFSRKLVGCAVVTATAACMLSCKGSTGPEGAMGTPGVSGVEFVSVKGTVQPVQPGSGSATGILSLRVECPAGKSVLSGGFAAVGDGSQFVHAYQSFAVSPTAWEIAVQNEYSGPIDVTAFAGCAVTQ